MVLQTLKTQFDTVLKPYIPSVGKLNECFNGLNSHFTALALGADNTAAVNLACYVIAKIIEFPTDGTCRALKNNLNPHLILQALEQPLLLEQTTEWASTFLGELKGAAETRASSIAIMTEAALKKVTSPPPIHPMVSNQSGSAFQATEPSEQMVARALQAFIEAKEDPVKLRTFFSGLGNPRTKWPTEHMRLNFALLPHLLQCLNQGKQELAEAYKYAHPKYLAYLVVVSHNTLGSVSITRHATKLASKTPDAYIVKWANSLVEREILAKNDGKFELGDRYADSKPIRGGGLDTKAIKLKVLAPLSTPVDLPIELAASLQPIPVAPMETSSKMSTSAVRSRGGRHATLARKSQKKRLLIDSGATAALEEFRKTRDDPSLLAVFFRTIDKPHALKGFSNFNRFVAWELAKAIKSKKIELCAVYLGLGSDHLAYLHNIKILNWGIPSYTILQHANGPDRGLYKGWMDELVARGIFIYQNGVYNFSAEYPAKRKHDNLTPAAYVEEATAGKRRATGPVAPPPKRRLLREVAGESSATAPVPATILRKNTLTRQVENFEAVRNDPNRLSNFMATLGTYQIICNQHSPLFHNMLCRHLGSCLREGKSDLAKAYLRLDPAYLAYLITIRRITFYSNTDRVYTSIFEYCRSNSAANKQGGIAHWLDMLVELRIAVKGEQSYTLSEEYRQFAAKCNNGTVQNMDINVEVEASSQLLPSTPDAADTDPIESSIPASLTTPKPVTWYVSDDDEQRYELTPGLDSMLDMPWCRGPDSFTFCLARQQAEGASTPDTPAHLASPLWPLRTPSPLSQQGRTWTEFLNFPEGTAVRGQLSRGSSRG